MRASSQGGIGWAGGSPIVCYASLPARRATHVHARCVIAYIRGSNTSARTDATRTASSNIRELSCNTSASPLLHAAISAICVLVMHTHTVLHRTHGRLPKIETG